MSWNSVTPGSSITVPVGWSVAVIASVKASHSAADLQAFAAKHNLVLSDYAEQGQREGLGPDPRSPSYRYVAAMATAQKDVSLPWSVPWPASMVDSSKVVSAWTAVPEEPGVDPTPSPVAAPTTTIAKSSSSVGPIFLIVAAGLLSAFLWDRYASRA